MIGAVSMVLMLGGLAVFPLVIIVGFFVEIKTFSIMLSLDSLVMSLGVFLSAIRQWMELEEME